MKRKELTRLSDSLPLDSRFAAYASAALATAAGVGMLDASAAQGAIVYSGLRNIVVDPTTTNGIYIDFDSNTATTSAAVLPGWDVNLFVDNYSLSGTISRTGRGLTAAHPNATNREVGVNASDFLVAELSTGTLIGPTSTFATPESDGLHRTVLAYQSTFTSDGNPYAFGDWNGGATNKFMGIEFVNAAGTVDYGWVRLTVGAGPTYPFTVVDWAYDTTGAAIVAVPEPAVSAMALGALALGAVRRPRKR